MANPLTLSNFMNMLHELDDQIDENITIRAIGGFSVILHSKTQNLNFIRMSEDIDSLTKTWNGKGKTLTHQDEYLINHINKNVNEVIHAIGEKYGINGKYSDWLNNSWYDMQMYYDELEDYIEWIPYTEEKFKHITLLYANLESIFLFKVRAIHDYVKYDDTYEPRQNDIYDIKLIFEVFDIDDIENIENSKMSTSIKIANKNFPAGMKWIKENIRL